MSVQIKAYIESGILVDYVLGLVTGEESLEVERMAKLHPEIQEEIKAIESSLELYAEVQGINPPPALKSKIWSEIQKEDMVESLSHDQQTKIIDINRIAQAKNYRLWLVAASVALLIGSSILNFVLYNKWKGAQAELIALNTENELFAQQFQIQRTSLAKTKEEIAFLIQPSTRVITLKGVAKFPNALATAYWNSQSHEVYLAINNLPIPPADKQYQLWAIIDGKPVDAGVFDVGSDVEPIHRMKKFKNAQAIAITLETKGGSPTPTLEMMYVIGNV